MLVITSGYSTGTIRATLTAVPQRRLMLVAKTIAFTATTAVVAVPSCLAAYFVFQAFVSDASLRSSISDPHVLRAVIGGGLYLTALGLLGLGLGTILRSSAGAVATLLGLLFVPPLLMELLPNSWKGAINPYIPLQAGSTIFSAHQDSGALAPWTGFGVFCLYAGVALVAGFVLIERRDA